MTALIILSSLAILIVVIVSLCAAGTIPVNAGVGIRIPATRLSERAWKAGHRAAYVPTLIGSALVILTAGLGIVDPAFTPTATVIVTVLLIGSLVWATIRAHQAATGTTIQN